MNSWTLVDEKTGIAVGVFPFERTDFRGDALTVTGGTPPRREGTSGYVTTNEGDFYPSVVGLKWESRAESPAVAELTPAQNLAVIRKSLEEGLALIDNWQPAHSDGLVLQWHDSGLCVNYAYSSRGPQASAATVGGLAFAYVWPFLDPRDGKLSRLPLMTNGAGEVAIATQVETARSRCREKTLAALAILEDCEKAMEAAQ